MTPAYPKNSDSNSRLAFAIVAWLFSLPAIFMSFTFFLTSFMSLFGKTPDITQFIITLLMTAAWIFLAIMTIAWLGNRRCHEAIPIIGTIVGLPMAIMYAHPYSFIGFASTAFLAFYLVYWHLMIAENTTPA